MSVFKLLSHFSRLTKLPVEIDDVIVKMKEFGVTDEIYYFWDSELDPSVLSGYIVRDEWPAESGARFKTTITYGHMGDEKERLVCCKELIHILDPESSCVSTPEKLDALIQKISLPPELVDPFTDGIAVATDRVAIIEAVAILFPIASRELLVPTRKAGKLSIEKIADLVELPVEYAAIVMSDLWPGIHDALIELRKRRDEAPEMGPM